MLITRGLTGNLITQGFGLLKRGIRELLLLASKITKIVKLDSKV